MTHLDQAKGPGRYHWLGRTVDIDTVIIDDGVDGFTVDCFDDYGMIGCELGPFGNLSDAIWYAKLQCFDRDLLLKEHALLFQLLQKFYSGDDVINYLKGAFDGN